MGTVTVYNGAEPAAAGQNAIHAASLGSRKRDNGLDGHTDMLRCPPLRYCENGIVVPSFSSVEELRIADMRKKTHELTSIYPRDGTYTLADIEQHVGSIIGLPSKNIVMFSTGMTALTTVVETAAPANNSVILHAYDEYPRTKSFLKGLAKRGVNSFEVDTLSMENLEAKIERYRPGIIVLETVANGPNVPVLDLNAFFSIKVLANLDPLIIFDNTLPTPTLIPPEVLMNGRSRIAVVESGTKFYSVNKEMSGIAYSLDEKLLWELREERIARGGMASVSQQERLKEAMIENREEFDSRNRRIMRNALEIALGCYEAQGDGSIFMVWHPNMESHPHSAYANLHFPNGSTPLFYIQASDSLKVTPKGKTQYEIAEALNAVPFIHENCELGHSFGLPKTRIFPDSMGPYVRIAAGAEDEKTAEKLRASFKEAMSSMR